MFMAAIFGALKRYIHYRIQLLYFEELDERTLYDIGVSRSELRAEAWEHAEHMVA